MPSRTPLLIVDAMNVIGTRPDGWWRDPNAAKCRLVGRLQRLAAVRPGRIEVVIDGRPVREMPAGEYDGVLVHYAGHSAPNAADDHIVALVSDRPKGVTVVTSDRELRRRVEALGARVEGATWLLDRIDQAEHPGPLPEP
ncbi:NYN domain-containing protein [Tautonia sp. JC769]|uniref:NYN domain-containing protein n=1 Tax=Tautonia sp. JC769 TaxID=3232135 RepID=UPI00345A9C63